MGEGLRELLRMMIEEKPMRTVYVTSEAQFDAVCAEMTAQGMRLAGISNSGLPKGTERLTFLPEDAFNPTPTPAERGA
jgi:hypothetical protein